MSAHTSIGDAPKILVVFYSRTGMTSKIASDLARRCGADVEQLHDVRKRDGIVGYLRSLSEALRKTYSAIRPTVTRWRDYDVVVLGTPVWAGHVASPVRAYLAQQAASAKRMAFFCTMGGRGAEGVFAELAQLTHMSPTATLALTDRQIAQRRYDDLLTAFEKKIVGIKAPTDQRSAGQLHLAGVH